MLEKLEKLPVLIYRSKSQFLSLDSGFISFAERDFSRNAVDIAWQSKSKLLAIACQRSKQVDKPGINDLYNSVVVVKVKLAMTDEDDYEKFISYWIENRRAKFEFVGNCFYAVLLDQPATMPNSKEEPGESVDARN